MAMARAVGTLILDELLHSKEEEILLEKPVNILGVALASNIVNDTQPVPKVKDFVEEVVPLYNDELFRRDFRIRRRTFHILKEKLTPLLEYEEYTGFGQEGLTVSKQILIFLWYLANQDSMREIGRLFGVAESTVHGCTRRVCHALCDIRETVITWPDLETQNIISDAVEEQSHVPNVIGFIDGTHIRLSIVPHADYINRKGYASINVQLIVDDNLLVRDCYAGWPGSTHDARVFRNSSIYDAIQRGMVPLGQDKYLIGDAAYPLSRFLITPFRDTGRLTPAQRYFNMRVSSARQAVERAIGHIKGRFRRLRDLFCRNMLEACNLIMSACVLHNLCVTCEDDIADFLDENVNVANNAQVNGYPPVYLNNAEGTNKRNEIVEHLRHFMR